jgi:hypothetical protein
VERPPARGRGAQHVAREAAVARAGFDDHERVGVAELVPAAVESARHAGTEQGTDLGARDEVAPRAPGAVARREEADVGLVQRDLDEPVERDRTLTPDQARDRLGRAAG